MECHVLPAVWVMAKLSGVCEIISFLLGVKYLVSVNFWSARASQKLHYQESTRYIQLGDSPPDKE